MKDEYLAIIIFVVLFIVFAIGIGYTAHNVETQEAMFNCVNSAIHNNSSLSVTEAGRMCMERFK